MIRRAATSLIVIVASFTLMAAPASAASVQGGKHPAVEWCKISKIFCQD